MAFGFIKKIFSFGNRQVEEAPPQGEQPALPPAVEQAPRTLPTPADAPVPTPVPAPAPDAETPVAAEPNDRAEPALPAPGESPPAAQELPPVVAAEPPAEPLAEPRADPVAETSDVPAPAGLRRDEPDVAETTTVSLEAAEPTLAPDLSPRRVAPAGEQPEQEPSETSPLPPPSDIPVARHAAPEPTPLPDEPPVDLEPVEISDPVPDALAVAEPAPVPPSPTPLATATPASASLTPLPASPPAPAGKIRVARSVDRVVEEPAAPAAAPRSGWLQRLKTGLSRSSQDLGTNLSGLFVKHSLTEDFIEQLEEVLIRADLGMDLAMRVTDALETGKYGRNTTEADVRRVMAAEIEKTLAPVAMPLELDLSHRPHVILVVGVNGTGKTTTIGKLAAKLTAGGLSVTLAAGDTFRAAAIEQLKIWGERTGSPVVATRLGADAAGLAYEAFETAKEAGSDVLIIDTAGRLQNKTELMAELEKIVRVLRKLDPDAPHTVLQTVDATTGQNALNQVEIFRNIAGVNGLVMTKLDGTARGGILVAIAGKHRLPVYFIGVGEQVDDLEPFSAGDFAKAIAGV